MGGGAYIIESEFNVLGGEISDNEAASTGGVLGWRSPSTLNVNGLRADRNQAGESGGVASIDTTATVKGFSAANCSRNEALRGGIAYVMGGALIKVNTSKFEQNKASSVGASTSMPTPAS